MKKHTEGREVKVLGIDLAKNSFHVFGEDVDGRKVTSKKVSRQKLKEFLVTLPVCTVAMEACASAHYWARLFESYGHEVRLIAPQFVKPYVKSNKNDAADAEAICEAAQRPNMRFVAVKQIGQIAQADERMQRLQTIPGIGPKIATALLAAIGDIHVFKNGRELAAWLGLVPRQHSTGGKSTLLGISKRGDVYLRQLIIHGARAILRWVDRKTDPINRWASALKVRRHKNIATVAMANKMVRVAFALLKNGERYRATPTRAAA